MIQANELRIGNWIADHEAGGYFQIEEICKVGNQYNVSYRKGSIKCAVDVVDLIPLTEEWLVKLGAEEIYKSKIHSTYYFDGLLYYFWYNEKRQYAQCSGLTVECEFVHELQNLYFALRKQELTIKN